MNNTGFMRKCRDKIRLSGTGDMTCGHPGQPGLHCSTGFDLNWNIQAK